VAPDRSLPALEGTGGAGFSGEAANEIPTEGRVGQTVDTISELEMKDLFFAVISIEASAWEWAGGFRCKDTEKAAKAVDDWKSKFVMNGPDVKRESIEYQGRQIQTESAGLIKLSSVWAGQWFFFANDIEKLKALLDRADGRGEGRANRAFSGRCFSRRFKADAGELCGSRLQPGDQFIEKLTPGRRKIRSGARPTRDASPDPQFLRRDRNSTGAGCATAYLSGCRRSRSWET